MKKLLLSLSLILMLILALASCARKAIQNAVINDNGELVLTYTDGTSENLGIVKGGDGKDGKNGVSSVTDDNPQGLAFYLKDDGTYAVGGGNSALLSEVTIPATYKGKDVTEVLKFCLKDIEDSFGSKLKKVIIPNSVTVIREDAFDYCYELETIVIPKSVTTIECYAFPDDIVDIYYFGTEDDWSKISMPDSVKSALASATIHYNYTFEE